MGSSLEEDHSSFIRKLLNPVQVDPWHNPYKRHIKKAENSVCSSCKETKPSTDFYTRPNGKQMSACRQCQSQQKRINRAKRQDAMGDTGNRQTDSVHRKSFKPKKPEQWANESLAVPHGSRSRKSV